MIRGKRRERRTLRGWTTRQKTSVPHWERRRESGRGDKRVMMLMWWCQHPSLHSNELNEGVIISSWWRRWSIDCCSMTKHTTENHCNGAMRIYMWTSHSNEQQSTRGWTAYIAHTHWQHSGGQYVSLVKTTSICLTTTVAGNKIQELHDKLGVRRMIRRTYKMDAWMIGNRMIEWPHTVTQITTHRMTEWPHTQTQSGMISTGHRPAESDYNQGDPQSPITKRPPATGQVMWRPTREWINQEAQNHGYKTRCK